MRSTIYLLCFIILSCNNTHSDNKRKYHVNDRNENVEDRKNADCGINDGKHSAIVGYHNPKTGYTNTYDLNVEVENCQVTTIYFENGGYLDSNHIDAADIDNNRDATVEDDKNRSFAVHIKY